MSIYNLGRVLPIFKGEYDPTETYENLDVVLYNGSSYVAINTTTNNLPTDENHWAIVALAGTLSPEQIEYVEQQVIEYVQGQGYVIDENYTHTDNNFTDAEKTKLDGIDMTTKQDTLVSGSNIKTVNNESLLGSGNIEIEGVSDYNELTNKPSINGTTLVGDTTITIPTKTSDLTNDSGFATTTQLNTKQDTLVSGTNIKTINNQSILGSGNINIEGGSGGTSDYNELTNKPSINGVELTGDKTNSQLGIPTKTSDLTNDSGFLTSETEPAFNSSVAKDITSTDISNWDGKQDTLVSGSNIKSINNQSILGSGNIEIEGVSDYTELTNKPSINGTTLNGNVTSVS